MATNTYDYSIKLTGFNSGDGTWTVFGSSLGRVTIDEDKTVSGDGNDTLSNSDGDVDIHNDVYSGWAAGAGTDPIMLGTNGSYYLLTNDDNYATTYSAKTSTSATEFTFCFLANTLITTQEGMSRVEELAIGDRVKVHAAEEQYAPVKFIFKQVINHPFVNYRKTYPICIKAHALGDNLPKNDMYVSPDHALSIDDILVEASVLVNDTSIYQVNEMPDSFVYYHIELENHELILAEGVAAETFIDNVSRESFDNYDEYVALYGEPSDMREIELPRAKSSRQLPQALRQRIVERGFELFPEQADKVA